VHDSTAVIESTLICEYVDEVFPDPPLVPKDTAGRAHMRVWSKYVDEGLFDGVAELSFSAMFRGVLRLLPHRWAVERRPSEVREFASSLDGEATGPVTIVVIAPCVSSIFASMPTAASSRPSRARSASRHG
jgi:glutathione S-transferase